MIGIIICMIVAIVYHFTMSGMRKKYPSGPLPLPFAGNIPALKIGNDVSSTSKILADYGKKYNGVFTLWMPDPIVVVTDPKLLVQVLVDHDRNFQGRPKRFTAQTLHNGDYGFMQSSGKRWRKHHNLLTKFLAARKTMIADSIRREFQVLDTYIRDAVQKHADGEYSLLDLEWPVTVCVANVISQLLWNKTYSMESDELKILVDNAMERVELDNKGRSFMLDSYEWLRHVPILNRFDYKTAHRVGEKFRKILMPKIMNRQNELVIRKEIDNVNTETCDYMTAVLVHGHRKRQKKATERANLEKKLAESARLEMNGNGGINPSVTNEIITNGHVNEETLKEETKSKDKKKSKDVEAGVQNEPEIDYYSNEQLCAMMIDLFGEAVYKTSSVMMWSIIYSCLYPQVQNAVSTEIRETASSSNPDEAATPSLLEALILETERLINITPINALRTAKRDVQLGKHKIRQGFTILPQLAAVGRNLECFPNATDFYPRRFLQSSGLRPNSTVLSASPNLNSRMLSVGQNQIAVDSVNTSAANSSRNSSIDADDHNNNSLSKNIVDNNIANNNNSNISNNNNDNDSNKINNNMDILRDLLIFGAGTRRCAGDWLSTEILKESVTKIFGPFELRLVDKKLDSITDTKKRDARLKDVLASRSRWCVRTKPYQVKIVIRE